MQHWDGVRKNCWNLFDDGAKRLSCNGDVINIAALGEHSVSSSNAVDDAANGLFVSPSQRWLAAGGADGTARVWELASGKLLAKSEIAKDSVAVLGFGATDDELFTLIYSGHLSRQSRAMQINVWDLRLHHLRRSWSVPAPAAACRFLLKGRFIVGFRDEQPLRVWSTDDFRLLWEMPVTGEEMEVAVSPDQQLLAIVTQSKHVGLRDVLSGTLLGELRGGHIGLQSVAFLPDGQRIDGSSHGSEAVKLWHVESRQELLTLGGKGSMLKELRVSPDGNWIGARGSRGDLNVWHAPSWDEIEAVERSQKDQTFGTAQEPMNPPGKGVPQ